MVRTSIVVGLALLLTSCSDPDGARRIAEASGLTDVQTNGYAWFACGRDDSFATRFRAKNPQGREVSGAVCSGWFKNGTVRFD